MEGHKSISDMSFEEFFSEGEKPAKVSKKASGEKPAPEMGAVEVKRGFASNGPKLNLMGGKFFLYVPRYTGGPDDRFETAIEYSGGVVPLQRLESTKQRGSRVSRPSTLEVSANGISPLEAFTFTIDGAKVYENHARQILFFNNMGMPMGRPMGDVTAVVPTGTKLRLVKAEALGTVTKDGLDLVHLDISVAGGVWVDDVPDVPKEPAAESPEVEEPVKAVKKVKKPAVRKVPVKGSIELPASFRDADVRYAGSMFPIYDSHPIITVSVDGCEYGDCTVRATVNGVDSMSPTTASHEVVVDTGEDMGLVEVILEKGSTELCRASYFSIPGLTCTFAGKGDLTDSTMVEYSMPEYAGTADVSSDSAYGPFRYGNIEFEIVWMLPYSTYDTGSGPIQMGDASIDIDDLSGDDLLVTIRGARKKTVFFGKEKGKKRELTPDWEGDQYRIPLAQIREEVYASPSSNHCFYVTVNSFPNRKFLTVSNPVKVKATFQDGVITVEVGSSSADCLCKLYNMDKTVDTVKLTCGVNEVQVGPSVVEAEIVEAHGGVDCVTTPVKVRDIPFLALDESGDRWMYVSRSKRIPLPDDLFTGGAPNMAAVRSWHDRIVRMNPELRNVTFDMMWRAFQMKV